MDNLNLDTLDLNDFDINDLALNESMEEAYKNIIYSYPFYSDEDYDYEGHVPKRRHVHGRRTGRVDHIRRHRPVPHL